MSLDPLALPLSVAALVTATLSGVFGMAGGMLLMAFLALRFNLAEAMVLHGLIQLASNGSRSVVHFRHAAWRLVPLYLLGVLPILGLALLVRFTPSRGLVLVVLGGLPLLAACVPRLPLAFERRGHASACGAVVMAAQLLAGASGALLDVFFLDGGLERREIVGTKAVTQSLGHFIKLLYYGGFLLLLDGGGTTPADGGSPALSPQLLLVGPTAAVLGTLLGSAILLRLSEGGFRKGSGWLIRGVSVVCLVRGVAEFLGT